MPETDTSTLTGISQNIQVFAPAKINLALHVTGQRPDGYHLLDTLVAFADIGDRVTLQTGGPGGLEVSGPEAMPELAHNDNIMWQVVRRFWPADTSLSLRLEKHLPTSSGIGGGSADAAATYRGMAYLQGRSDRIDADVDALLDIGADVPMCVHSMSARVQGIGQHIQPLATFPTLPVVLVNPRLPVSTPAVFRALKRKDNSALDPFPARFDSARVLLDWVRDQRNDLQEAALQDCPAIGAVLAALSAQPACRLARMSGSGASCFGLYDSNSDAAAACESLQKKHPDWWVQAGQLGGGGQIAPQVIRSTT